MGRMINIDKINPVKRDTVSKILEQLIDNEYIDKIVIFGSSTTDECRDTSDLDIAIGWREECFDSDYVLKPFTLPVYRVISKCTKGNNDVIPIGYEGHLKEAIDNGVVVYEH